MSSDYSANPWTGPERIQINPQRARAVVWAGPDSGRTSRDSDNRGSGTLGLDVSDSTRPSSSSLSGSFSEYPSASVIEDTASTSKVVQPADKARSAIDRVFAIARSERFEDGMESRSMNRLQSIILKYGDDALVGIAAAASHPRTATEVLAEVLRLLGRMMHRDTYLFRRWLLTYYLADPRYAIRDAAFLGLDYMKDRIAGPYLRAAASKEPDRDLGRQMAELASELEKS